MQACTHDGIFHADDVLAEAVLRLEFPGKPQTIRSRRPEDWARADILSDVGGKCNLDEWVEGEGPLHLDHHQKGGAGEREGVPYAAAGLSWKAFGGSVWIRLVGRPAEAEELRGVDRALFQGVDAADNGVAPPLPEGVVTFSNIVAGMNPPWTGSQRPSDYLEAFEDAVSFATGVLRRTIQSVAAKTLAADVVRRAFREAIAWSEGLLPTTEEAPWCRVAPNAPVIVLDRFCPWQECVLAEYPGVLYVVFPAPSSGTGGRQWNVQCVPDALGGTGKRKALPATWAGLPAEELRTLTGVPDAVFCHAGRFICGAASREGAVRLAELAVEA